MKIESIEDIRRMESRPLEEVLPAESTYQMLAGGARGRESKAALRFISGGDDYQKPLDISYGQLLGRVHQTANLLHSLGVGPEDAVSVMLPNLPQTHFALWGAQAAGIVNPVNPLLGVRTLGDIMTAAQSRVLIALGPHPQSDIWEKALHLKRSLPGLKTLIRVGGGPVEASQALDFDARLDQQNPKGLDSGRSIAGDEIASYFHTGGTTGTPKLARLTHRNQVYNAWVLGQVGGIGSSDVLLCGLPLFHVNAVILSGLTPFSVGAEVVLLSPSGYRDPSVLENFFAIVEHFKATSFSAVPTVYARLLEGGHQDRDLSSLKDAICGAAPMPTGVFQAFQKATGVRIQEGYGLTEATCASACNPKDGERRVGSIGLRLPYQEMKAARVSAQGEVMRDCKTDEVGAVLVRGPNVFAGYVRESDNRGVLLEDGWLDTGDLGRRDQDGYFWLTGRQKEIIIRGGHNIDPRPIEEALSSHPAVALAAAVGRPDPDAGELPVAFVSLKPGQQCDVEDLFEACRQQVDERAAWPKTIQILPEIPVTPVGKVYKPGLRLLAAQTAFKEALQKELKQARPWSVRAKQDPRSGIVVDITVEAPEEERPKWQDAVARAVKGFSIPCKIVWERPGQVH